MTEWSDYFQNPEFLESTRMFMLDMENLEFFIKHIGIKEHDKILDVGCGTGKFSDYLGKGVKSCSFTGLDNDNNLLNYAKEHINNESGNEFTFVEGDALALPFEDNTFDITVSHTFLTNICDGNRALKEMKRVTKAGGIVAAVTAQSTTNIPCHPGYYPAKYNAMLEEYYKLFLELQQAYEKVKPRASFLEGAPTLEVPHLFASAGFKNVRMYGIGRGFSLSDSRYPPEQKEQYIMCQYRAEIIKLEHFEKLPEFCELVTEETRTKFREYLLKHRDMYMEILYSNRAWEWYGGSSVLMVGTVPADLTGLYKMFSK